MPNFKDYKKLIATGKKLLNEYMIARKKNPMIRLKAREFRGELLDLVMSEGKKVAIITCRQCNGLGQCYYVDAYNNLVRDAFGNPVIGPCQNCQGNGVEIVELV